MHHFILGPGGVGGLIAGVLAHSDETVSILPGPHGHPNQISVESKFGTFTVAVRVTERIDQPCDVLWIAVKAPQLESALQRIPQSAEFGCVVPLLNGVDHLRVLRDRFGDKRAVAATIAVESERVAPGRIVHRSPFARLNVSSAGRDRLASVVDLFARFGFECKFVDDEATLMWSKLVFLAPLALATTSGNTDIGGVMGDPQRKERLDQIVREACAVASAEGAKVDADFVIRTMAGLPGGMRTSMQKDVAAGRKPELDAIAGPILRGAAKHGIQVSVTGSAVEAIERGVGGN